MKDVKRKNTGVIMSVGSAIFDTVLDVDDAFLESLQLTKGDMTLVDQAFFARAFTAYTGESLQALGGSAANTLFLLGQLGHVTRFVAVVGDDTEGDLYRETQEILNGDATYIQKHATLSTGRCMSMVTPDYERTMCTDLGASATLTVEHCPTEAFKNLGAVHLEGYLAFNETVFLHAINEGKRVGAIVSTSVSAISIAEDFRDFFIEKVLPRSDVFFANEEEAMMLTQKKTPEEALDALCEYTTFAVVTCGARGAIAGRGGERSHVSAIAADVVDTTGAGDAFAAGFLHGILIGSSLEEALQWGIRLGAAVVTTRGARLSNETVAQINNK